MCADWIASRCASPHALVHIWAMEHCTNQCRSYSRSLSGVQKPRHSNFLWICKDSATPMASIIHPLLALLASLTRQELARQVTYLKAENRILRSKLPNRITLSNQERRTLIRHGKKLGARLKELVSIVSYSTFRKWMRSIEDAPDKRPKAKETKPGRPRVEESIGEAIIRIRKETGWGYTKIVQAMRRLGHKVSRQTIKNVIIQAGLGPEPHDHPDTWSDFLSGMPRPCGSATSLASESGRLVGWSTYTSWSSFTSVLAASGFLPARPIHRAIGRHSKPATSICTCKRRICLARYCSVTRTPDTFRRSTTCSQVMAAPSRKRRSNRRTYKHSLNASFRHSSTKCSTAFASSTRSTWITS